MPALIPNPMQGRRVLHTPFSGRATRGKKAFGGGKGTGFRRGVWLRFRAVPDPLLAPGYHEPVEGSLLRNPRPWRPACLAAGRERARVRGFTFRSW